jgi:hypothetical protein
MIGGPSVLMIWTASTVAEVCDEIVFNDSRAFEIPISLLVCAFANVEDVAWYLRDFWQRSVRV